MAVSFREGSMSEIEDQVIQAVTQLDPQTLEAT